MADALRRVGGCENLTVVEGIGAAHADTHSELPHRAAGGGQDLVVFPTFEFAFFFPVVLTLSWALMPHQRLWKPFALTASYVFYAAASPRYCILLAAITLANQLGAVLVHHAPDDRRRKRITAITVAFDLGLLGVF